MTADKDLVGWGDFLLDFNGIFINDDLVEVQGNLLFPAIGELIGGKEINDDSAICSEVSRGVWIQVWLKFKIIMTDLKK